MDASGVGRAQGHVDRVTLGFYRFAEASQMIEGARLRVSLPTLQLGLKRPQEKIREVVSHEGNPSTIQEVS